MIHICLWSYCKIHNELPCFTCQTIVFHFCHGDIWKTLKFLSKMGTTWVKHVIQIVKPNNHPDWIFCSESIWWYITSNPISSSAILFCWQIQFKANSVVTDLKTLSKYNKIVWLKQDKKITVSINVWLIPLIASECWSSSRRNLRLPR